MNATLWTSFSSELALIVTAIVNLLLQKRARMAVLSTLASLGILTATAFAFYLVLAPYEHASFIHVIPSTQILKILELFICFVAVMMTTKSKEIHEGDKSDVFALLLLTTVALSVMVSTTNLLVLFLSYEMTGMGMFILSSFRREDADSSEASLKAFFHSALSSIMMAAGLLLLYTKTGSFDGRVVSDAIAKVAESGDALYLVITFAFMLAALLARMGMFPFQGAQIDTVDGAPTPVSAFVSTSTTIVSTAFATAVLLELFGARIATGWTSLSATHWKEILALLATAAMILGNLASFSQKSMRRWFAYFFLAQTAFTFVGLSIANPVSISAMIFTQVSLIFSALGAWVVMQLVSDEAESTGLEAFNGLAKRSPFACTMLSIFLLSLAGIPPFAGFIGKFYLLGTVIEQKSQWLAAASLLNWIFSIAAIVAVMKRFFIHSRQDQSLNISAFDRFSFLVMGAPVFVFGIFGDLLMKYLMRSIEAVQHFF